MKGVLIYKLQLYYKDEYIRLFQGDCLEVMDRLIEKEIKFDAIITDPPYGTTQCKWDSIIPIDKMWERLNQLVKDNTAILLFCSQPFTSVLGASNLKLLKYDIIWNKRKAGNFAQSNKQPLKIHEELLVFYKKQPTYNPQKIQLDKSQNRHKGKLSENRKDRKDAGGLGGQIKYSDKYEPDKKLPTSIKEFKKDNYRGNIFHPTQKPVELIEYLINTYTNENELILDFTCGSGTTLLAARNLKRKCIGIELEEKYCEIAKNRLIA